MRSPLESNPAAGSAACLEGSSAVSRAPRRSSSVSEQRTLGRSLGSARDPRTPVTCADVVPAGIRCALSDWYQRVPTRILDERRTHRPISEAGFRAFRRRNLGCAAQRNEMVSRSASLTRSFVRPLGVEPRTCGLRVGSQSSDQYQPVPTELGKRPRRVRGVPASTNEYQRESWMESWMSPPRKASGMEDQRACCSRSRRSPGESRHPVHCGHAA